MRFQYSIRRQNCEQKPGIRLHPRQIGQPAEALNAELDAILRPAFVAAAENAKYFFSHQAPHLLKILPCKT